ncbi:unnamed protein product, partial [marine sediment metagenome]
MRIGLATEYAILADNIDEIRDLGIQDVKFSYSLSEDAIPIAEFARRLERVRDWGLRPIIDLRTERGVVKEMVHASIEAEGVKVFASVYRSYGERFAEVVKTCEGLCDDWEWWGEPHCPHVTGGAFTAWDYAQSLRIVYEAAHEAVPDCRVWSGGFGVSLGALSQSSGMRFLQDLVFARCPKCGVQYEPHFDECIRCRVALREGAGKHFDVANLHPYAHARYIGQVLGYHDRQLKEMRAL